MRILIVEDNASLATELAKQATRAGFVADCVGSCDEAREIARQHDYAMALVDRGLPDGDGIVLVADLRRSLPGLRLMMLTVMGETRERIEGLDAGADDYLTKPFEPDELMARMRACLRRPGGQPSPPLAIANLRYSPVVRLLQIDDSPVILQRRELMLLESLLRRAGRVTTREALAEEVFGSEDINWQTLAALVSQLRIRLKDAGAKVEIHTARGIGYLLAKAMP